MAETPRYDQPIKVSFGGQEITAAPLKGLARIKAFEQALVEEVSALANRVEGYARSGTKVSAEVLLESGVDEARLLKLALPDVVTDELLDESTAKERIGLLSDLCYMNNLGRFAPFLALEGLIELASKLNQQALLPFPTPELSSSSSESDSAGAISSAS